MEYIQEITLDLNSNNAYPVVFANQGDTNSRFILVHYTKDGEQYIVNSNNSVALRVRKPDAHLIFDNCVVKGSGDVEVPLTYQCLSVAGKAFADLIEFNSNGQTLSTQSFIIEIQPSPDVMDQEALSSNEFLYLKSFIDRGNEVIGNAQKWAIGFDGDREIEESEIITEPASNNNAKYWANQARQNVQDAVNNARDEFKAIITKKDNEFNDMVAEKSIAFTDKIDNIINSITFSIDMDISNNNENRGQLSYTIEYDNEND